MIFECCCKLTGPLQSLKGQRDKKDNSEHNRKQPRKNIDPASLLLELVCNQSRSMKVNQAATPDSTFIFQLIQGIGFNRMLWGH